MATSPYNYQNILDAYEKVGVASGKTVLVHSDLRDLGAYEAPDKKAVLEGHQDRTAER